MLTFGEFPKEADYNWDSPWETDTMAAQLRILFNCKDTDTEKCHFGVFSLVYWASLVAQLIRIHLQCGKPGFNPWVGKIPWRRE